MKFENWLKEKDPEIFQEGKKAPKEEPELEDLDVLLTLMKPGYLISLGTERYNGKCVHDLAVVLRVNKKGVKVQPLNGKDVQEVNPSSLEEAEFPPSFKRQLNILGQHIFWEKKKTKSSTGSSSSKSKSKKSSGKNRSSSSSSYSSPPTDMAKSISDLLGKALDSINILEPEPDYEDLL